MSTGSIQEFAIASHIQYQVLYLGLHLHDAGLLISFLGAKYLLKITQFLCSRFNVRLRDIAGISDHNFVTSKMLLEIVYCLHEFFCLKLGNEAPKQLYTTLKLKVKYYFDFNLYVI